MTKPPASPTKIGDDAEEEEHDHRRDHPRGHELLRRVGAEGAHGVDLLGDLHRAEFAGHAAGIASGDHQAGQHRTEFAHHGERHELSGERNGAELLERGRGVQGKGCTGKKTGKNDDGKRTNTDQVGLLQGISEIARMGEQIRERTSRQLRIALDGKDLVFRDTRLGRSVPCAVRDVSHYNRGPEGARNSRDGNLAVAAQWESAA